MLKNTSITMGTPDIRQIGFRIRAARQRKKLTQAYVASRAGIDKGHLSRIERGEKSASLGTLHMLSVALETSLSLLMGENTPKSEVHVRRAVEHQLPADSQALAQAGHHKTVLKGGPDNQLSMVMVQVTQQGLQETAVHGGEEVVFVLEGSVRVQFDQHEVVLARHDSVSFPGYLSHRFCAVGGEVAQVLVAIAGDTL